jgi:hypothetical protein
VEISHIKFKQNLWYDLWPYGKDNLQPYGNRGFFNIDYCDQRWDFRQPLVEIFNIKIQEHLSINLGPDSRSLIGQTIMSFYISYTTPKKLGPLYKSMSLISNPLF